MLELHFGSFELEPEPYPARPRWCGEFHQLEQVLFSSDDRGAAAQAERYADSYAELHLRSSRTPTPVPDAPTVRVALTPL